MSRTKKKPKTGAKAIDPSCKNHGSCPWCKGNRTYQQKKAREAAEAQVKALFFAVTGKKWEVVDDRSRAD